MLCEKRWANIVELESKWKAFSSSVSLFGSWAWFSSWWQVWADSCDLKLELYSFHLENGSRVAIVPLFFTRRKTRLGVELKQLQVFGNCYPTGATVLSEYTDILVNHEYESCVSVALNALLRKLE